MHSSRVEPGVSGRRGNWWCFHIHIRWQSEHTLSCYMHFFVCFLSIHMYLLPNVLTMQTDWNLQFPCVGAKAQSKLLLLKDESSLNFNRYMSWETGCLYYSSRWLQPDTGVHKRTLFPASAAFQFFEHHKPGSFLCFVSEITDAIKILYMIKRRGRGHTWIRSNKGQSISIQGHKSSW